MAYNLTLNASFNEDMNYYDIESNLNDEEDKTFLIKLIVFVLIYLLTFLLGLIGNSLVIFSILTVNSLNNITNIFLISLATADLLLIIICVPMKVKFLY